MATETTCASPEEKAITNQSPNALANKFVSESNRRFIDRYKSPGSYEAKKKFVPALHQLLIIRRIIYISTPFFPREIDFQKCDNDISPIKYLE